MIGPSRVFIVLVTTAVFVAACAPGPERSAGAAQPTTAGTGSPGRVLNLAYRHEVAQLIPKIHSSSAETSQRWFNAFLTLNDNTGSVRPYLAEALPQLNTDTWRVFPDGRMETTYKLRPGLTWHDGQALSAEDFVFAWRVYTDPSLGEFTANPQDLMETVTAADPRTLVIRWHGLFPNAGNIQLGDLDPLPRHLLDQPFASLQQTGPDAFLALPFWTTEYIGAGPYRLTRWEPGSFLEGVAFDGHALGRPKIDRVILRLIVEDNAALTNLLAGGVDFAELRFEHGQLLLRDWVPEGKGVVIFNLGSATSIQVQQRPEYVGHRALLDVRVRQALVHSLDRPAINDGVFQGQGFMTDSMVPPTEPFYPEIDRAIAHYPYDLRRAEQLLNEAGLAKDREGFFANAGGRFGFGYQTGNSSDAKQTQVILMDAWRRAGIEAQPSFLPSGQVQAAQSQHVFPGIAQRGGGVLERFYTTAEIGAPENRWTGDNRTGWSNADYDRAYQSFLTTLDRSERTRQFVQMQRLLSEQVPVFFTYFLITSYLHVAALHGPTSESGATGTFTQGPLRYWNVHEWEWQ